MLELIEQLEDMGMSVKLKLDGSVRLEDALLAILKRIQSLEAQLELNADLTEKGTYDVQPQG